MEVATPWTALVCGAMSGLAVDVTLFPLDTLKTRLQALLVRPLSSKTDSNEFISNLKPKNTLKLQRNLYSGIIPTLVGSAPSAAVFFVVYESSRKYVSSLLESRESRSLRSSEEVLSNGIAAGLGETAACLIRVPQEILKQRLQAGVHSTTGQAWKEYTSKINFNYGSISKSMSHMYRGFSATLFREIPFSMIQFPLFEYIKHIYCNVYLIEKNDDSLHDTHKFKRHVNGWESAICGSISGAIAAALTTPLDVIKTNIMVQTHSKESKTYLEITNGIIKKHGFKGLFTGLVPRVTWISIGGFIFLGTFDTLKFYLN